MADLWLVPTDMQYQEFKGACSLNGLCALFEAASDSLPDPNASSIGVMLFYNHIRG